MRNPGASGPPRSWLDESELLDTARAYSGSEQLLGRIDPTRSLVVGTGPAHRNLAEALGARYRQATT